MRRVWDAVIVASAADLDLLEARFAEFEHLPVTHVIAECPVDFQGNPKPMHFADLEHVEGSLWQRRHGRWNHVRAEPHELPQRGDAKVRKDALREYLADATCAEPDDIVLHGSVDEVPSARALEGLLAGEAAVPVAFEMRHCAYRPHLVHPLPWRGTVAQEWRLVGSFAGMREKRLTLPAIVDGGTRLSMWGEDVPDDGMHPDGHALWETQVDGTWPKWVRARLSLLKAL